MEVKRYKPQCRVRLYTETGNLVARATSDPNSRYDDDIVSVQTGRDMGADAPTFSIDLTRRKAWHQWVSPNDLIIIDMVRPPENNRTVFVGLVDDIRKRVSMESDNPQRVITISGRGMAKAFLQFDIGTVPNSTDSVLPNNGWLVASGLVFNNRTAHEILEMIWDNLAKKFVNYKFSDDRSLFDIAKRDFKSREDARLVSSDGLSTWQGSMCAFMKEICDQPFNELFWETDGEFPVLFSRATPFNQDDWNDLPITSINDEEVVLEDIGRSDVETFTVYQVGMKPFTSSTDMSRSTGLFPYWYEPYADKYGIRRLYIESLYNGFAESKDKDVKQQLEQRQKDIFNWNIKNNSFFNGTFIVRGSNRFKIGTRLVYVSEENGDSIEFYIRSVAHRFVNYGTWVTVLGVIRGCKPEDRFKSPWGEYKEYMGTKWSPLNPENALDSTDGSLMPADSVKANALVNTARSMLGKLQYSMSNRSVDAGYGDCSSFTQWVYAKNGITLGSTTGEQVKQGYTISSLSDLQLGDLVFFTGTYDSGYAYGVSHVGIYSGNGNMIHHGGGTGPRESSIEGFLSAVPGSRFLFGKRLITDDQTGANGGGRTFTNVLFTAYGGSRADGQNGTWLTASGTTCQEGRTIAVDPKLIKLGSKVRINIPGRPDLSGVYTAEDTGGAIKGRHIDIYFNDAPPVDPQVALKRMSDFGKQYGTATVL